MEESSEVALYLDNTQWLTNHAGGLLEQYRLAKTERRRAKLLPKLITLMGRLQKEKDTLDKLANIGEE